MKYKFNLNRKIFHLSGILIPIMFFFQVFDSFSIHWFANNTRSILFYTLVFTSLFLIVADILRFRFSSIQKLFIHLAGPLLKPQEHNEMNGSIAYMLGNTILIAFFPKEIVIVSMLFLLFGDPSAAFIGSRYGSIKIWNGRSLEGSITGIFVGVLFGSIFFSLLTIFHEGLPAFYLWSGDEINFQALLILLVGSFVAFFLEAISTKGLFDDNFLMPVGSALAMLFTCHLQKITINFYPISKLIFPIAN